MALPPLVAAGELIESSWGNDVSTTLAAHAAKLAQIQANAQVITTDSGGAGGFYLPVHPAAASFHLTFSTVNPALGDVILTLYGYDNTTGFASFHANQPGNVPVVGALTIHWIAIG